MKSKFAGRLLAITTATVLAIAPLAAAAYSSVVIFGDSLSDSGNNASIVGTAPNQVITGNSYIPTIPFGQGAYTNAQVWANAFVAGLGLPGLLPSRLGGSNFAYGGAETSDQSILGFPPSLQTQMSEYLATSPTNAADTLFVVAGGGNNARATLERLQTAAFPQLVIGQAAAQYAQDISGMVNQLQGLGAQDIVVWNTPNIGLVPAITTLGPPVAGAGTAISSAMNSALAQSLAGEIGVITFDVFGLLGNTIANASAYGLVNVTDACGAIANCDPDTYLFWDGIHPTSAGHALIAQAMLAAVVPEPATLWLFAFGIAGLAGRRFLLGRAVAAQPVG